MNWQKQTADKPLFEDMLWSRPENKRYAGKLLIVGGNKFGFSAPAICYNSALTSGAGSVRVVLPDSTSRTLGKAFPEAEFVPSTPSGSFSRSALGQLLEASQWADSVILAGDFGRNSETAVLLESFATKYSGHLIIGGDGIDYFLAGKSLLLGRENTVAVINMGKLQKLTKNNRATTPVLHNMDLNQLINILSDWTSGRKLGLITKHLDQVAMAFNGKISTTPLKEEISWQTSLPAYLATWWMQQKEKPFEALTTAVFEYAAGLPDNEAV